MPKLITKPSIIEAAGTKPKIIEEFIGHPVSPKQPQLFPGVGVNNDDGSADYKYPGIDKQKSPKCIFIFCR